MDGDGPMERVITLVRKRQQPAADLRYWLSRPMAERIAAVKSLRTAASQLDRCNGC
ncbi:MAG: hypothetical protein IPP44_10460 [Ideonella sp.]|nr:hypothetical protein [Ideonella sp.]